MSLKEKEGYVWKQPLDDMKEESKEEEKDDMPTHEDVIRRFSDFLEVDDLTILKGTSLQQVIVGLAGIAQEQKKTSFKRNSMTNHTEFTLRLSRKEENLLEDPYSKQYPSLIKNIERTDDQYSKVTMDSRELYENLAPSLNVQSLIAALGIMALGVRSQTSKR